MKSASDGPRASNERRSGGGIAICGPHTSLESHYFVPGACCIVAVVKVSLVFVVRCVFSLIHATRENPISTGTAHIAPLVLRALAACVFVAVHFGSMILL